jgi:hypothetical protein
MTAAPIDDERERYGIACVVAMMRRAMRHAEARLGRPPQNGDITIEDRRAASAEGAVTVAELESALSNLPPPEKWPSWGREMVKETIDEFETEFKTARASMSDRQALDWLNKPEGAP